MLRQLILAGVTAAGFTLGVAPGRAASPEVDACMDAVDLGASKTTQWLACETAELARQDQRLNTEYKLAHTKAVKDGTDKALVLAERQWMAYRDAWCNFDVQSEGQSGDGPEVTKAFCMVEMTSAQADKLHSIAN